MSDLVAATVNGKRAFCCTRELAKIIACDEDEPLFLNLAERNPSPLFRPFIADSGANVPRDALGRKVYEFTQQINARWLAARFVCLCCVLSVD